jgi:hypothetical protein
MVNSIRRRDRTVEAREHGLHPCDARRDGQKDERNTDCRIDHGRHGKPPGYDGQGQRGAATAAARHEPGHAMNAHGARATAQAMIKPVSKKGMVGAPCWRIGWTTRLITKTPRLAERRDGV